MVSEQRERHRLGMFLFIQGSGCLKSVGLVAHVDLERGLL